MKYKITLDSKVYEVEVEKGNATLLEEYEAAAPKVSAPAASAVEPVKEVSAPATTAAAVPSSGKVIVAPLPGAVLDVMIDVGDIVKEGDVVAIIEAMKMENEVIAVISGKVVQVLVTKGNTVNTGDQLFVLD